MKNIKSILAAIAILISSNLKAQDLSNQAVPLKVKEYGVGLSNLNSFSLQYRWGNEKRLFRINATIGGSTGFGKGSGNSTQTQDTTNNSNNTYTSQTTSPINFNSSLSFSILNIKYVAGNFGLMYGGVAGITYSIVNDQTTEKGTINSYSANNSNSNGIFPFSETKKNHTQNIKPFIGIVLGATYKISETFLVYLEITPNIYFQHSNTTSTTVETNLQPNQYIINGTQKNSNNIIGIANLSNSGAMLTFVYRITK